MSRSTLVSAGLIASLIMPACSDPVEPGADWAILTDADAYVLKPTPLGLQVDIPFVFRNRTSGDAYVVNCNGAAPPILQRFVDNVWTDAWAPVVPACLSPPIVIPAGTTYGDKLRIVVSGREDGQATDLDPNDLDGLYRLLWPNVLSSYDENAMGLGDPLPLEERVSNSFTLERQS